MMSWGHKSFGCFKRAMEKAELRMRIPVHLRNTIYLQPEHSYWMAQAAPTSQLLLFIYNANVTRSAN